MKKCNSNCKTTSGYVVYYTPKKSPSPLGLGWCVNCGPIGEKRIGYDGHAWVRTMNGTTKRWNKIQFRFNPLIEYIEIENCLNGGSTTTGGGGVSLRRKTPKKKRITKKREVSKEREVSKKREKKKERVVSKKKGGAAPTPTTRSEKNWRNKKNKS